MIQSYKAFSSKIYKIIMLLIYPLAAIFGCILVQSGCFGTLMNPGFHFLVASSILANCMIFVENIADYFLFSGIQSRSANHMDFIKGSKNGRLFFKNALITDTLRRILTIAVCNAINVLIGIMVFHCSIEGTEGIFESMLYPLCCYFFSTLGIFISRFGDTWWLNFGCGYGASIIMAIMTFVIFSFGWPSWIWCMIFLAASIVISIVSVKIAMKKVEDSYYDQRP